MVCLTQKLRIRTRNSSLLCGPWAHGRANWNVRSEYLEQRVAAAGWNARKYGRDVFLAARGTLLRSGASDYISPDESRKGDGVYRYFPLLSGLDLSCRSRSLQRKREREDGGLTRSIGNIWRRSAAAERSWKSSPESRHKTSGKPAAGVSASRRDAGVRTRKKRLGSYVEGGSIRLPGQPSPRDSLSRH